MEEREKLVTRLQSSRVDSAIVFPLIRKLELELNSIHTFLSDNSALRLTEKEKAERSLGYFITELHKYLDQGKMEIYDIPAAVKAYKSILTALVFDAPITHILQPLDPVQSQLIAAAFTQYKEHALLDEIAIYKRVAASPQYILQFLENKPWFRYSDSLLLEAVMNDPLKIVSYLNNGKDGIKENIRNSRNDYVRKIVALSEDKQASELLPFLPQIGTNKITAQEVLQVRTDAGKYFQLLVNTLQQSIIAGDPQSAFLKPLRNGIRQKALSFYVNEINDLHSAADAKRFASVKGLRPQDLYYIITSCGEDLYTSSYLGLYKRLMENFRDKPADSLFHIVQHDNFRSFIRLAANYNVLGDLLHKLTPGMMKETLQRYIGGIEKEESSALEKAMDIADAFTSIGSDAELAEFIKAELQANLNRTRFDQHFLGMRLYRILSDMFILVTKENGVNELWATLGDYELLKKETLLNDKGKIIQLALFYGDEDGVASFSNFLRSYTDKNKWAITKNQNWVSIRSLPDEQLVIFANLPLDIKEELDLKAQDSLAAFLEQQSLQPTVIIHRGHSYHLEKTLNRINPDVRLAILGSCGSYNKAISFANINPDIQVIGSKKTGAMSINDPILDQINQTLVSNNDIHWPEIWKQLESRFNKDPGLQNLFSEYFPPSKNLGLFVLKLFKNRNRVF